MSPPELTRWNRSDVHPRSRVQMPWRSPSGCRGVSNAEMVPLNLGGGSCTHIPDLVEKVRGIVLIAPGLGKKCHGGNARTKVSVVPTSKEVDLPVCRCNASARVASCPALEGRAGQLARHVEHKG